MNVEERNKKIYQDRCEGKSFSALASEHNLSVGYIRSVYRKYRHTSGKAPEGELALAHPMMFNNHKMDPFNPSLLVTRKGLSIFDQMRKDDQAKAALLFKKMAVLSTDWEIVSPKGKPPEWEPTLFIDHVLRNLEHSLKDCVVETLSALDYGFCIQEKVFETVEEGDFVGQIGLKAIKAKHPHHIDFATDDFGNLLERGIIQHNVKGKAFLPIHKFIIFSYQKEFSNWYGRSELEAAYTPWWVKTNAYRWLAMLLERFGIPPIFAMYNPNVLTPAQVDKLVTVVERLQAATAGAIPRTNKDALEMWSPELAGQADRVFIPALEMFNRDIARALLMPGLLGMTVDNREGSFARARVHFDVFLLVVEHLRQQIEQTVIMDQVIKPLIKLNYDVEEIPIFRFMPITDGLRMEIMSQWSDFVGLGIVRPQDSDEDHIRNAFNFPKVEDEQKGEPRVPLIGPGGAPKEDGGGGDKKVESNALLRATEPKVITPRYLQETQRRVVEAVVPEIQRIEKQYRAAVKATPKMSNVKAIKLLNMDKAENILWEGFVKHVYPSTDDTANPEIIKNLKTVANRVASIIHNDLLGSTTLLISNAARGGTPDNNKLQRYMTSIFKPYTGDKNVSRDGDVLRPIRLEQYVLDALLEVESMFK